jgi:hypothetical protein
MSSEDNLHIRFVLLSLLVGSLLFGSDLLAQSAGRRRALLIGINDYSASSIAPTAPSSPAPAAGRQWPSLTGALNDVHAIGEMLTLLYGFEGSDIVILTDQHATRAAILRAIQEQLVDRAAPGDVLFFYYAGHGSQVRNSLSDEPDLLDESLVPADSLRGAPDIRDKELRPLFNCILDRGARLTILLDSCHSGSGARGLPTGAAVRGVAPDLRDIRDSRVGGPRPENRGALVLTAAEDFGDAHEIREEGQMHGAFSAAWMHAMRDASPGETARETFLRAQARLRAGTPFQDPVMAGNEDVKSSPFLGRRIDRQGERTVAAVETVRDDGTVVLQGGWANGLSVGSELRPMGETASSTRLSVTTMLGLGRSEAAVIGEGATLPAAIHSGSLLEMAGWAASPARPLRVWMPQARTSSKELRALGRTLQARAAARHLRWITDPLDVTPRIVLRPGAAGWEMLGPGGARRPLGSDAAALAALETIPPQTPLFVQFPAPAGLVETIGVGPGTDYDGVEPVESAEEADYILVGRVSSRGLGYAWLRPAMTREDRLKSGLPPRSAWEAPTRNLHGEASALRKHVLCLRRVQGWHVLESPPEGRSPYSLARRRRRDHEVELGPMIGDETYDLLLTAPQKPAMARKQYVYAFIIDSSGKSDLLFPPSGSVENRLPLSSSPSVTVPDPPREIPLGHTNFRVSAPYGVDTYFLLTTDEPLPDTEIFRWQGVRAGRPLSPLEQLIASTGISTRGPRIVTPVGWSIERVVCESVPPRRKARTKARTKSTHHARPRRRRA